MFKSTGNKRPRGHVTDTECRPDVIAAFDWAPDDSDITLWPCIQLAGEKASKGKSRQNQQKQAISYLHYILLARPDLHVAQGLLTFEDGVTLYFGIAGYGVRSFTVRWSDDSLYGLIYAFVYRLYEPAEFADPSYVNMIPNWEKNLATYTMRITEKAGVGVETVKECPGFEPIYASNPFETRTHIFSNPHSRVMVDGKLLTVLKDQLCRLETRFDEHTILTHIHDQKKVPGVVEAVYYEQTLIPPSLPSRKQRGRRRIGLGQFGRPFSSISTLQQMLEIVFDILEGALTSIDPVLPAHMFAVLRYLRFKRQVLHRDISKGNVVYLNDNTPSTPMQPVGSALTSSAGPSSAVDTKEVSPCFIKYLLGERYV